MSPFKDRVRIKRSWMLAWSRNVNLYLNGEAGVRKKCLMSLNPNVRNAASKVKIQPQRLSSFIQ
jgi:hypothetical protein